MHTIRNSYLTLRDQGVINLRLGSRATIASVPRLADKSKTEADVRIRLKQLITDALLSGLTLEDIRKIVGEELTGKDSQHKGKEDL